MNGIKIKHKGVKLVSEQAEAMGCGDCYFNSSGEHKADCWKMPCTQNQKVEGKLLLYPIIWKRRDPK